MPKKMMKEKIIDISKPKEIRNKLNLSLHDAARIFLGRANRSGYDQWYQWEQGIKTPSQAADQYFSLILLLITCKELHTPGADKALDIFINLTGDEKTRNRV